MIVAPAIRRLAPVLAVLLLVGGCQPEPPEPILDLPLPELHPVLPPATAAPVETAGLPAAIPPTEAVPEAWQATAFRPWRYIVIHHSATAEGAAESFDRLHRGRGWDEVGYHFVITNGRGGPDGAVEPTSRWRKQKWGAHCGGTEGNAYNVYGIGVCLVGDFTDSVPTDAQLASLRRLLRHLMGTHDIPPERVIGHRDAPQARTECPGDRLHEYLHLRLLREVTASADGP